MKLLVSLGWEEYYLEASSVELDSLNRVLGRMTKLNPESKIIRGEKARIVLAEDSPMDYTIKVLPENTQLEEGEQE